MCMYKVGVKLLLKRYHFHTNLDIIFTNINNLMLCLQSWQILMHSKLFFFFLNIKFHWIGGTLGKW